MTPKPEEKGDFKAVSSNKHHEDRIRMTDDSVKANVNANAKGTEKENTIPGETKATGKKVTISTNNKEDVATPLNEGDTERRLQPSISEYERTKLANIERNKQLFQDLQLDMDFMNNETMKTMKKKVSKPKSKGGGPRRTSARQAEQRYKEIPAR